MHSEHLKKLVSVLVSVADPEVHNSLQQSLLRVEPMAGIEPATDGLRNRCSTAELHWRPEAQYSSICWALCQCRRQSESTGQIPLSRSGSSRKKNPCAASTCVIVDRMRKTPGLQDRDGPPY